MIWEFNDVSVKHCHKIPSSHHILLDHPPLSQHWRHHVSYFPRLVAGTSWWRHTCMFPNVCAHVGPSPPAQPAVLCSLSFHSIPIISAISISPGPSLSVPGIFSIMYYFTRSGEIRLDQHSTGHLPWWFSAWIPILTILCTFGSVSLPPSIQSIVSFAFIPIVEQTVSFLSIYSLFQVVADRRWMLNVVDKMLNTFLG